MNTLVWRLYKHYLDLYQRTSMVLYTGKVWDKECSRERKAIDNSIINFDKMYLLLDKQFVFACVGECIVYTLATLQMIQQVPASSW